MEGFGGFGFNGIGSTARKRRSNTSRRPRNESQSFSDYRDVSSWSSTPPSDHMSKVSSDENTGYVSSSRNKELNQCSSKASSVNVTGETTQKMFKNEDGGFGESNEASINGSFQGLTEQRHSGSDSKRCSEGVLAPANWKIRDTHTSGMISGTCDSGPEAVVDGLGNENKLKKVKLKVGGVTHTIHAKSTSDGASVGGSSSTKSSRASDAPRQRQKLILQDDSDDDNSPPPVKGSGLQGVPWKDFSRSGFSVAKGDSLKGKMPEEGFSMKQAGKYEPVRKSKRVPKKRVLDGAEDDEDNDEEIKYLEKLKTSKVSTDYGAEYEDEEEDGGRKQRKISRVLKRNGNGQYNVDVGDFGSSKGSKESKKSRSGRAYEDIDYMEEEEALSDGEPETKKKKLRKEFVDSSGDSKREMAVTTRQRALQTSKDISASIGVNFIEFPNGLPPAPPRKQKEKLTEVEQQLKKAEAAQRRRMQVEKAARESEAEAIRKILGQDSSRKKREEKIKKRQEELAQERAANALTISANTVRWVMGPTGTTVTFPNEMGLPSIFEPKLSSYPPPREKCAGPSCMNPYKYRDSKSKLPLCSLQCYRALHAKTLPLSAC